MASVKRTRPGDDNEAEDVKNSIKDTEVVEPPRKRMFSPIKFPLPSPERRNTADIIPRQVSQRIGTFSPLSSQKRISNTFSPLNKISTEIFSGSPSGGTPSSRRRFATKNVDECNICSNQLFEVCHPHISTQQIEARFQTHNYFCPICHKQHPKQVAGRRSMVLGSSTLHNVWKVPSYKPDFHVDFDCIIGGRIHDVHASFLDQYTKFTEPLDIVLACGVNNIPTDDTAKDIIFQFKSFVKSIKEHNDKSRVIVATLLYAPKYCDNRLSNNNNMVEKVREVNKWIEDYNQQETGKHLKLHLHGVEGDPSVGNLIHKYNDWREPQWDRKLHFSQDVKSLIARDLVKLFNELQWTK